MDRGSPDSNAILRPRSLRKSMDLGPIAPKVSMATVQIIHHLKLSCSNSRWSKTEHVNYTIQKCGICAHITHEFVDAKPRDISTNELVMQGAYTTGITNLYYTQLPSSYHLATKLTRLSCKQWPKDGLDPVAMWLLCALNQQVCRH